MDHKDAAPATQDFHQFLHWYQSEWPQDVLEIHDPISHDQEITAVVRQLAERGQDPVFVFHQVHGLAVPVVTNLFASRKRVARMLGVDEEHLHAAYQQLARQQMPPRLLEQGPVLEQLQTGDAVDLNSLPMLKHFESDRAPYISNALMIAEHPETVLAI